MNGAVRARESELYASARANTPGQSRAKFCHRDRGEIAPETDEAIDWSAATPELKRIAAYAAQGDMTNVKLHIGKLNAGKIGKSAYQQLTTAIKHYDLELIEKLIKSWLE